MATEKIDIMRDAHEFVNSVTKEMLGSEVIVEENLGNITDIGRQITNIDPTLEMFASKLLARIAKYTYVDRVYSGFAPNVRRDAWEWGCILAKIQVDMPDADINEDWTLENGTSYDPNVFNGAEGEIKVYNKYVTFMVNRSIQGYQLKAAFNSAAEMAGFISTIMTQIKNSLTIKEDGLVMSLFQTLIIDTLHSEDTSDTDSYFQTHTGTKVRNLLKEYNDLLPAGATALTVDTALKDAEFIRFANNEIMLASEHLTAFNNIYNIEGKSRFTSKENQRLVLLADYAAAAKSYLYSDTYNKEFVQLGSFDVVPYWEGIKKTSDKFDFESVSTVAAKTSTVTGGRTQSGVIGVLYDANAIGVFAEYDKVESQYNPVASFTNYWFKRKAGYFCQEDEQAIVFIIDAASAS